MKYTEKNDKKQDAKLTKGMTPTQKKAFAKADDKHKKVKTQEADAKIDKKIAARVRKTTK